MQMKEIIAFQREFDKKHGWDWGEPKDNEEKLQNLQYGVIALTGEVGEFANIIKKTTREFLYGTRKIDESLFEKLKDELADIFIYVLKISVALQIDLEKTYLEKMRQNEERFERFVKE